MNPKRFSLGKAPCAVAAALVLAAATYADDWWKPHSAPCTERENVFAFAEKPAVKLVAKDKYEITFAVKGACDVTVDIVSVPKDGGRVEVVRHLASGVLGPNAPEPFQKDSLSQRIYWNGKDDLDFYHKKPETLRVRVRLGLDPQFDRLIGAVSPYSLPGGVNGIAASPEGVFVFVFGVGSRGHGTVRQFDHDGTYMKTILPPPADMPAEKQGGLWAVEYEPGKRSLMGMDINPDMMGRSNWLPYGIGRGGPCTHRPVIHGNRIYFSSTGFTPGSPKKCFPALHWIGTDGSSELRGVDGRKYFTAESHSLDPRLALSPDGRTVYAVGVDGKGAQYVRPAVMRFSAEGTEPAEVFAGDLKKPGSDASHFNGPCDVACDTAGRVYVADLFNNRIQVYSDKGEHLKKIEVRSPHAVQVHRKTGEVYVVQLLGESKGRGGALGVVKFKAFPDLSKEFSQTGLPGGPGELGLYTGPIFTLDSWSSPPRLWIASAQGRLPKAIRSSDTWVWEEADGKLKKVLDFNERVMKDTGESYHGRWLGSCTSNQDQVACDPVRGRVYLRRDKVFDLRSGRYLGRAYERRDLELLQFCSEGPGSGIAFDKRGYMHIEFGYSHIARIDPDRLGEEGIGSAKLQTAEVPYDYGVQKEDWKGVIDLYRTGRHPCGIGVNMRGDVADVLNVEIVPKMDDIVERYNANVYAGHHAWGHSGGTWMSNMHGKFVRSVQDQEKLGVRTYYVKREPGLPIGGGTVWTWDRTGEVRRKTREEATAIAGHRINGVQIDEDGRLYFSNCRWRMRGGKPFLADRAGRYGSQDTTTIFTGTYMKTDGERVRFRCKDAPIPVDQPPRPEPDLSGSWGEGYATDTPVWIEGAEWLYAGASPMKPGACMCPQISPHLDWYKRSFVPEHYRHSIGVLDTAGNLILHIGQYGNFDSGAGADSTVKVGGDGIASTGIRHVSGTDEYLVFLDWSQRLVSLKLAYHAEETTAIGK